MLNELRDLAKSLKNAGISPADWHSKFKKLPKYKAFWVYPSVEGKVEGLEPVMRGQIEEIRKWEPNNGWSFPAINVPPFYATMKNKEVKKKVNEIKKRIENNETVSKTEISALIEECNPLWDDHTKTKIENSLISTTIEVKKMLDLDNVPQEFTAVSDLIGRVEKMDFYDVRDKLSGLAVDSLSKGKKEFFDILFNTQEDIRNVQLILDLGDWAQAGYDYPATHQEVQRWMNKMFLAHEKKKLKKTTLSPTDAFGEDSAGIDEQKFPGVKLPVLGNVKLRAMFKDTPAQIRYGMIEAGSFPTGAKVRMEMKSALEWLSMPELRGKTWCDITRRTDKSQLLFAYPTTMPESPPELAGMLGEAGNGSRDPEGALFSAIAKKVTGTLKGIASSHTDSDVRIFILAKMDKARTKVLVSRRYATEHMISAAEAWQAGCENIPAIRVRQFGREKGNVFWAGPLVPFPAEMAWCLNTAWRRQGRHAEKVHGYSMNDALSLLLDSGYEVKRLALRAIESIVRNASPLFLSLGQENHFARVFKVDRRFAKQPLLLPSIMGLLLYKLDNIKGGYMNSTAFLVGRFMSLADKLHLKYCEHVRKKSIPPRLVGNALMPAALQEPVKALAMLSQRILPYKAWADTLREGDDAGLVRYFLGQLGEVSAKLKDLDIPVQCNDTEKAQMLLGYLYWSEKVND